MSFNRNMGQGDLEPPFNPVMLDRFKKPVDLSSVTSIKVNAKQNGATLFSNRAATGDANGQVEMDWVAGDTNTLGDIELEVKIEWSSGRKQTVPAGERKYIVTIVNDLA